MQLQICANRTEVYFILSKVDSPSKLTARDSARERPKEKQQPCTRETTMTSPPRCSALKQTTGFGKSERHLLAGNGQTREPFGPWRTRTSRHPKAVALQLRSPGLGVFSYKQSILQVISVNEQLPIIPTNGQINQDGRSRRLEALQLVLFARALLVRRTR